MGKLTGLCVFNLTHGNRYYRYLVHMPNSQQSLKCWCDAPAEFVNPATDTHDATPVCHAHVADGYQPLSTYEPPARGTFYVWPSDDGFDVRDRHSRTIANCPTADDAQHVAFALNHTHDNR